MSISRLAICIIVAPMIALLGFAGVVVGERWTRLEHATELKLQTELAVAAGNLAHALQIERGASTWRLATGRSATADIAKARSDVDEAFAAFSDELERARRGGLKPANVDPANRILDQRKAVADLRQQFDTRGIEREDLFSGYSESIEIFLNLITSTVQNGMALSRDAGEMLTAYRALSIAKEFAGRQRAIGAVALTYPRVRPGEVNRLTLLSGMEHSTLDGAAGLLSDDLRAQLDAFDHSEISNRAAAMWQQLVSSANASAGMTPSDWFAAQTDRIDRMHQINQDTARSALAMTQHHSDQALAELSVAILIALLASAGSLLAAALVTRAIARPLADLTRTTHALAAGDLNAQLSDAGPKEIVAMRDALEVFRDNIRNNRNLMRELAESNRLASLGALVAGVAHEVNTPVGNAMTVASSLNECARTLKGEVDAGLVRRSSLAAFLNQIQEASDLLQGNLQRAAVQIRSFKQMAVDQTADFRRKFDLKATIEDAVRSCTPMISQANIKVRTEVEGGIEPTSSPGGLSQIIINLLENAIVHGLAGRNDGQVLISARASGDTVRVDFSDNGAGIPPDLRDKVFRAFFTTRAGVGGSGLGLHIVKTIARSQLAGEVNLGSTTNGGAHFVLEFPLVAPAFEKTGANENNAISEAA